MPKRSAVPEALVLSPEPPYPIAGGGQLRTSSIIEFLRRRFSVHVITFEEPGSADPRANLPPGVRMDVIRLPRHSKAPASRLLRNISRAIRGAPPLVDRFAGFEEAVRAAIGSSRYAVGVVEHFWCAPYAPVLRPCCQTLLLNLHNVESVLLRRSGQSEPLPVRLLMERFAKVCARLEAEWYPAFDYLLVASPSDSQGVARSIVYPNAIPSVEAPGVKKKQQIVFSGNLEYLPNKSALRFFHDHVWSILRRRHENLVWHIVGRNHEAAWRTYGSDRRIVFTGPVDDPVQTLAESRVAVAPLLAGSGTRIKIIEAWAAGVPVVATTIGAEGLPAIPGRDLLIADTPEAFADTVSTVLANPELERQLSEAGRRLYEEHLTWEAAWRQLRVLKLEEMTN